MSANENMGMPFAIVVNLEDFTVRKTSGHTFTAHFPPKLYLLSSLQKLKAKLVRQTTCYYKSMQTWQQEFSAKSQFKLKELFLKCTFVCLMMRESSVILQQMGPNGVNSTALLSQQPEDKNP